MDYNELVQIKIDVLKIIHTVSSVTDSDQHYQISLDLLYSRLEDMKQSILKEDK